MADLGLVVPGGNDRRMRCAYPAYEFALIFFIG